METFNLEIDGYVSFIATIIKQDSHFVEIKVEQVNSWDNGKEPSDKEIYLNAYMKWDGCCHLNFGESLDEENAIGMGASNGYLHLCGPEDWKKHCHMMIWLYKLAEISIPHFDVGQTLKES